MQYLPSRFLYKLYNTYIKQVDFASSSSEGCRWLLVEGLTVHRYHPAETSNDLALWIVSHCRAASLLFRISSLCLLIVIRSACVIKHILSLFLLAQNLRSNVSCANSLYRLDTLFLTHSISPDDPLGFSPFKDDISNLTESESFGLLVFDHYGHLGKAPPPNSVPYALLSRGPLDAYGHKLWLRSLWMRLKPDRIERSLSQTNLSRDFQRLCGISYTRYRSRVHLWQALRVFREIQILKPKSIVLVAENHPFERFLVYLIRRYTNVSVVAFTRAFVSSTSYLSRSSSYRSGLLYSRHVFSGRLESSMKSFRNLSDLNNTSGSPSGVPKFVGSVCFLSEGHLSEVAKFFYLSSRLAHSRPALRVTMKLHPKHSFGLTRVLLSILFLLFSLGLRRRVFIVTQSVHGLSQSVDFFVSSGSSAILDVSNLSSLAIYVEPGCPDISPFWSVSSVKRFSSFFQLLSILDSLF